jgi:HK97 gp10 family phage protein
MAKTRNVVRGDKEILAYLKTLDKEVKDILSEAAEAGAKIVYDDARSNVPVDTGNLRESIEMKEGKKTEKRAIWQVRINLKKAFYGAFVELGTKNRPARPFLRRAVDRNKRRIGDKVIDVIKNKIKKVR